MSAQRRHAQWIAAKGWGKKDKRMTARRARYIGKRLAKKLRSTQ